MSGSCQYCTDCGKSINWLGRCVQCAHPAPMSRREEVDSKLASCRNAIDRGHLARTLADEVDDERAIVTKLLAELMPDESIYHMSIEESNKITSRYARACEIAGRKE